MSLNSRLSSLLQWLATFDLDGRPAIELKEDAHFNLADGYICARILNQISPQHFTSQWLEGIKPVPLNGSWHKRVSNLRRILQKTHDYASDLQIPHPIAPDVGVIAQNFDPDQISRLIQLILFCAINCNKKQDYIGKFLSHPTQVQVDLKEAILGLHSITTADKLNTSHLIVNDSVTSDNGISCDNTNSSASNQRAGSIQGTPTKKQTPNRSLFRDSSHELSKKNETSHLDVSSHSASGYLMYENIEDMKQAYHDLELRLKQLQLEKEQLAFENERLISNESKSKLTSSPKSKLSDSRRNSALDNEISVMDSREIENRIRSMEDEKSQNLILQNNKKLKSELQRLKEELMRVETEKEDFRLKSNLLAEDLEKMTLKRDELRNKAEQAKRLQDELDEHKHISEKVVNYETMMENLVKKNNEMKKELKNIEEKNLAYIQKIVKLEAENKELLVANNRIEIYKKQLQEVQVKLSQETHRADKTEVELTRLHEKYAAAKKENEKLYETTNQLMRSGGGGAAGGSNAAAELKAMRPNETVSQLDRNQESEQLQFDELNSMSTNLVELKERLTKLECENELLQNKLNAKREHDHSVLGGLLENANTRCTKLEIENRQSKKKILLLESRLKDLVNNGPDASTSAPVIEDSSSDNTVALINRVGELQRLLYQKEQELMDSQVKYKRNLQKAKDVIKTLNNQSINGSLHPSCMSSASPFNSNSLDEVNLLRQQLHEREERIIEIEREFCEFKKFKEIHERLIISAFYGLTTPMQWRNAEKRLERTTLTSPPNTASSSMNHSKHSH